MYGITNVSQAIEMMGGRMPAVHRQGKAMCWLAPVCYKLLRQCKSVQARAALNKQTKPGERTLQDALEQAGAKVGLGAVPRPVDRVGRCSRRS